MREFPLILLFNYNFTWNNCSWYSEITLGAYALWTPGNFYQNFVKNIHKKKLIPCYQAKGHPSSPLAVFFRCTVMIMYSCLVHFSRPVPSHLDTIIWSLQMPSIIITHDYRFILVTWQEKKTTKPFSYQSVESKTSQHKQMTNFRKGCLCWVTLLSFSAGEPLRGIPSTFCHYTIIPL